METQSLSAYEDSTTSWQDDLGSPICGGHQNKMQDEINWTLDAKPDVFTTRPLDLVGPAKAPRIVIAKTAVKTPE